MAVTIAGTFAPSHSTILRPAIRRPTASLRSSVSIAAVALLLVLLVAMAPGMARVPTTMAGPQRLPAPSTTATLDAAELGAVVTTADPTPQPGPHPGH